jgi:outer membrane receptor protein involved in Fe transport
VVSRGDAVGALPLVAAPWTVFSAATYEMDVAGSRVTLSAQDMYTSRNPGPFSTDNTLAVTYAPLRRANPSTNVLNLRATAALREFELSLFINNVLDSQPTLQVRNHLTTSDLLYATTFRPRTVGLMGNIRF